MQNVLWWLSPFSAGCKTVFNSFPVLGSDIIYRALNGIAVFLSGANTNKKQNLICFFSRDCFYHSSKFGKTRQAKKKMWKKKNRWIFALEMFFTAMVSISILNHGGLDGENTKTLGPLWFLLWQSWYRDLCHWHLPGGFIWFNLAVKKRALAIKKGCLMKSKTIDSNILKLGPWICFW